MRGSKEILQSIRSCTYQEIAGVHDIDELVGRFWIFFEDAKDMHENLSVASVEGDVAIL